MLVGKQAHIYICVLTDSEAVDSLENLKSEQ
jgi:hypothetical protein